MNRNEAEKVARSILAHRPDWNFPQVMAVLGDSRVIDRTYADASVVGAQIATDPATNQPTRLFDPKVWRIVAPRTQEPAGPAYKPFVPERDKPKRASQKSIDAAKAIAAEKRRDAAEARATREHERRERAERTSR